MALITAVTVVAIGVEEGIILAIVLSVIIHLRHSYRPNDRLVTLTDDGPRTTGIADGTQARPGLVIYRFGANLYYANAARLSEEILALVDDADPPRCAGSASRPTRSATSTTRARPRCAKCTISSPSGA